MFFMFNGTTMLILLIYVDDIIVTESHPQLVQTLITHLNHHFALKDLGPLSYFLGIEVSRTGNAFHLCQQKYISDLLKRTEMWGCKPHVTPMSSGPTLSLYDGEPLSDATTYHNVVGALQYCTLTRLEISYSVNKVCQFMHALTSTHWQAIKHILRYLKATLHHGCLFKPHQIFHLCVIQMQIGLAAPMIEEVLVVTVHSWAQISFPGLLQNKRWFPVQVQNQNIGVLPMQQQSLAGLNRFFVSCKLLYLLHHYFYATILVPPTLLPILLCTLVLSM